MNPIAWETSLENLVANVADAWHARAATEARKGLPVRGWYLYYAKADPTPGGHWGGLAIAPQGWSLDPAWTLAGPRIAEAEVQTLERRAAWLRRACRSLPIVGPDDKAVQRILFWRFRGLSSDRVHHNPEGADHGNG